MTIFLYLIITLQCSRHSTLGKNTKQTFILLLVPLRSSCSKYATRGNRGLSKIDEFVSEFNELIIKVECIKYATLVITEISKGDNLENRN
jgi:hypothetical protein